MSLLLLASVEIDEIVACGEHGTEAGGGGEAGRQETAVGGVGGGVITKGMCSGNVVTGFVVLGESIDTGPADARRGLSAEPK